MEYRQLLTVIAAVALLAAACSRPVERTASWPVMGQTADVRLFIAPPGDPDLALSDLEEAMRTVEEVMSFDRPGSELSTLNRQAREDYYSIQDEDLYRCVLLALDWARASRGAFDPTVGALVRLYRKDGNPRIPQPGEVDGALEQVGWDRVTLAREARAIRFGSPGMELDLGGVAKGFALDAAARVLARAGSRGALLRIGGNVYAWDHPPGERWWSVAVDDPRAPGRPLATVRIANRGLAVSGNPEGVASSSSWVLDPQTGRPAGGDLLVAVAIGHSAADADAIATSLLVSGYYAATDLLTRSRQVEALLLVRREERPHLLASTTLRGRLELSPELRAEIDGDVRYLLPPLSP